MGNAPIKASPVAPSSHQSTIHHPSAKEISKMSAPVPMVALLLLAAAAAAALASPDAAASDGSSAPAGTSAGGGYTTSFVASARSGSKHGDGYGHG